MGTSSGAVDELSGPREALLLFAQGEAGQGTAADSEVRLKRGLTANTAEAGKAAGAGAVVVGAKQIY